MAKIVLGAAVESIKGKLGGTAIRKTRAGHILTHTVHPAQKQTAGEARVRRHLNRIAGDWAGLSDLRKDAWNRYASMQGGPLTGANVYVRHNTRLLNANHASLSQINMPPATPSTPDFVRGLDSNADNGSYTITWTTPDSASLWVQVQHSIQVGFSMTGKERWTLLPAVASNLGTTTHTITLPQGYSIFYRARSIDNRGRVSPWSVEGVAGAVEEPWYNPSWEYRKSKDVTGTAAGPQSNYQLQALRIHYGSGSDDNDNVYLSSHGNADFSDVRFTATDKITLIPYWIRQKVDSDYCDVIVRIDAIPIAGTTVYLYYGNAGASHVSSGADTFIVFDDFTTDEFTDVGTPDIFVNTGTERLEFHADRSNTDERTYRDIGVQGNTWRMEWDHTIGALGLSGSYFPFGLWDTLANKYNYPGDFLGILQSYDTPPAMERIFLQRMDEGVVGDVPIIDQTGTIFITVLRESATAAWLGIYTDRAKTTHAAGSPVNLVIPSSVDGLRYLQGSNFNDGYSAARYESGYIETLRLGKYADPEPAWSTTGPEEPQP